MVCVCWMTAAVQLGIAAGNRRYGHLCVCSEAAMPREELLLAHFLHARACRHSPSSC